MAVKRNTDLNLHVTFIVVIFLFGQYIISETTVNVIVPFPIVCLGLYNCFLAIAITTVHYPQVCLNLIVFISKTTLASKILRLFVNKINGF